MRISLIQSGWSISLQVEVGSRSECLKLRFESGAEPRSRSRLRMTMTLPMYIRLTFLSPTLPALT